MKYNITRLLAKSVGLFFLSFLIISCQSETTNETDIMLKKIGDHSRFVSSDLLAKRIIDEDPSIMIIDVRTDFEYDEYSIPGAINVPAEFILDEQYAEIFMDENKEYILYSNASIYSDKAWNLLTQTGKDKVFVLEGGLNNWFTTIMLPEKPMPDAQDSEFDLYSFRKGASLYFGGSVQEIPVAVELMVEPKAPKPVAKKKVEVQKKVKKEAEGGC